VSDATRVSAATVLLKGVPTVIGHGQDAVLTVASGNPGLATGGRGDVLSGLAGELASYLRDGGFDVLVVSNADRSDYRNTLVVNRGEWPEQGNIVADYLGTRHVIQQARAQEMIDVTVIVGRDARRWTQPR
jgi:hypothetical protein